MKIHYNSPVILTYALISVSVLVLSSVLGMGFKSLFILNGNFQFGSPVDYFRLFSNVAGHANWSHLLGNFSLILIVGPNLEEKYGGSKLLSMIGITAFVSAVLNIVLFKENVLGASGIAFMLILLSSFSSFKKGAIPLTFVLVFGLYIGREIMNSFEPDHVSQFSHIIGGICGAFFGFNKGGTSLEREDY